MNSRFKHATPRPAPDPAALERFAAGADRREPASAPTPVVSNQVVSNQTTPAAVEVAPAWPWLKANSRIKIAFQLRLPEPVHVKLAWLSEQGEGSMHELVMAGVEEEIARRLQKRGVK